MLCLCNATYAYAAAVCATACKSYQTCNTNGIETVCESKHWHMSIMALVVIIWGLIPIIPQLSWLIFISIVRRSSERAATLRDMAIAIVISPATLISVVMLKAWNKIQPNADDASTLENGLPEPTPLWNRQDPSWSRTTHFTAVGIFFTSVLALLAALPVQPALACTLSDSVQSCTVPAGAAQLINGEWYYLKVETLFTTATGAAEQGTRGTVYTSLELNSQLICDITSAVPPDQTYIKLWDVDLPGTTIVNIPPATCWGGSLGVSIGTGIGLAVSATVVECPGTAQPVNPAIQNAAGYSKFSSYVKHSRWSGYSSYLFSLCQLTNDVEDPCVAYPLGSNDLYIKFDNTISANADGAIAQVRAPSWSSPRTIIEIECSAGDCWYPASYKGDCPQIYQTPSTMPVSTLLSGGLEFDPSLNDGVHTQPTTGYKLNSVPDYFSAAAVKCGQSNEFVAGVSLVNILSNSFGFISRESLCVHDSRTEIGECYGPFSSKYTGQASPIPADKGRPIVTSCETPSGFTGYWTTSVNSIPIPISPGQTGCQTLTQSLMTCTICSNGNLCFPKGKIPPSGLSIPGGISELNNNTWIYPPDVVGNLCALIVIGAGPNWILVHPVDVPCVTIGAMGSYVLRADRKLIVNSAGWVPQLILNGTLVWEFHASYNGPGSSTFGNNITVTRAKYDARSLGLCPDCACDPWDCRGELVCLMTKHEWESCKCSLITGNHPTKTACNVFVTLVRIAVYVPIAVISLMIIFIIVKKLWLYYHNNKTKTI